MTAVKTAISVNEKLFKDINSLARKMHISRSEIFAIAAKEFIENQKNKKVFSQLNKVFSEISKDEKQFQKKTLKYSSKVIDQW